LINKEDNEIIDFNLSSIVYLNINESDEVRKKLSEEHKEENFVGKKIKT
jgi:hypothetical protein